MISDRFLSAFRFPPRVGRYVLDNYVRRSGQSEGERLHPGQSLPQCLCVNVVAPNTLRADKQDWVDLTGWSGLPVGYGRGLPPPRTITKPAMP
jgi:hypothetical protein